jgi:hypothetical protein
VRLIQDGRVCVSGNESKQSGSESWKKRSSRVRYKEVDFHVKRKEQRFRKDALLIWLF